MSTPKKDATYRARLKEEGFAHVRIQLEPELKEFVEASGKPRAVFVKELVEEAARKAQHNTQKGARIA